MDLEKTVRESIKDLIHLSLATIKDNKPWVCEVHFAYDEDLNLYFRSTLSRRHSQEIKLNHYVAGNIVKQFSLDEPPLGVYFEGEAKLLAPGDEQNKAFECIDTRFGLGEKILEEAKNPEGHQFYKISVASFYVFGKLDGKYQKCELKWGKNN